LPILRFCKRFPVSRQKQRSRLAWSEYSISQQVLGIWVDATTTQLERLEAVQNELDLGLTEIDALLEVQSALVEVQIEQISARYAIVRAQIALLRVMGFASPVAEE
jgi:outer membrane protein TolC